MAMTVGGTPGLAQEADPDPAAAPTVPTDLLRAEPFDRVTLVDGTVIIVEPLSPRPLPTIDKKKAREAEERIKNPPKKKEVPEGGNIGLPGQPGKVDPLTVEIPLHVISGIDSEIRDFKVRRSAIDNVEYFEDLLLGESARLLAAREFARAFECCLRVRLRDPRWPGLDDHINSILFGEGSQALAAGDADRGLRLLRELLARNRDFPDVVKLIGSAYGKRIDRAIQLGLYARGRRILHELELLAPQAAVAGAERAVFVAKAKSRLESTAGKTGPERLDALTESLRIWPALDDVAAEYERAFSAMPTLDVGVVDVPTELGPWLSTPADARLSRLLYVPILAADDEDARLGKHADQLAEKVESSDLGRRLLIQIRSTFRWSDDSRPVSPIDVVRTLVDRTDPNSPQFEARWESVLDRVDSPDPGHIEIRLRHAPIKLGALLMGPVGPAHGGRDGRIATAGRVRPLVTSASYRAVAATSESVELAARDSKWPIQRIREHTMPPGQSAVGALRRGDVSVIEHVPPDQVAALAAVPGIKVGRYDTPAMHVLAVDGRNPVLRDQLFRRGLSYAIDRKRLLEEFVLKSKSTVEDTVADGPFIHGSYADAVGVRPLENHPGLAKMLVHSRDKLGGGPVKLNLEYPALPEIQPVVAEIAKAFQQAGVQITLIEMPQSRLERELRAGRRFDLAYRIVRCREPILDAGLLLCPGFDSQPESDALASTASPRILQLLLQLEIAADYPSARELAIQIDRESRDKLPVIPLWQVVDHFAWRTRLTGPSESVAELYQGINAWEIKPWIAKDQWAAK
jgi:peptide/nickel transport system substrate-binding protein